jgi:hypothetical protein
MKRARLPAPPALFGALFAKLRAAGHAADCHYVWRALAGAHSMAVPPSI